MLPSCDRCRLYAHSPYLICAAHPGGPAADPCPDFEGLSPEQRGELRGGYCSGDWLPMPAPQVMDEGQWLDFWTAEDLETECDR